MSERIIEKSCPSCKKTYPVRYKYRNKNKYCSHKCYIATKKPNITLTCPQCGKVFTQWASKVDKCCSRYCGNKLRRLPIFDKDSSELLSLLKEFVSYSPETGLLTWIKKQTGDKATIEPGTVVSFVRPDGYMQLTVRSRRILAHRAAWALHHGEWPRQHLDHINRIKTDNRMANLRQATRAQNHHNRTAKNNTGVCGIYLIENRYRPKITHNRKQYNLGSFGTLEEAIKARQLKASELGIKKFLPN